MPRRTAFCYATWLLFYVVSSAHALQEPPPLFTITASSLYDAGLQHGRLASTRIQTWLASNEVSSLWNFTRADGADAYLQLRRDSSVAFPHYADELRGIAEGAGVCIDRLWVAMLMIELENLMQARTAAEHCSDIFAIDSQGFEKGFAHGHNEDWSPEVGRLYYYVKYIAAPGANFSSCAGLAYPGALIGWSATWNEQGVFMTVNTLKPRRIRMSGFSTAFVQREAMCGFGKPRDIDAVIDGLTVSGWSDGASVNLVDVKQRRLANVETYEGQHDVLHITESMGNYSHFNAYKRLGPGTTDLPSPSSVHRQARMDRLQPPRSREDIALILSDEADADYPIFRNETIATLLLDGHTGRLNVWCCQQKAASGSSPSYTWDLLNEFSSPIGEPLIVV